MNRATLAQGNHLLHQRLGGLALGDGGLDTVHENDRGNEVAEDGAAVTGIAAQLEPCIAMTHELVSFDPASAVGRYCGWSLVSE